jgi:hypothetical protein
MLLATALAGCQHGEYPTYRAGGTVAFSDGAPVTSGSVEFRSVNTPRPVVAKGEIQPDGTFALSTFFPDDGAVEGKHQAVVVPRVPGSPPPTPPPRSKVIDPRFLRYETTPLRFTVGRDASGNRFRIVVTHPAS